MSPRPELPPALARFLELYRCGRFFEGHEVLEQAWLRTRSPFYQGLIIMAAAFCKRDRGNGTGAARNLRKALRRLEACPPVHLGLDVAAVRDGITRRLERLRAEGIDPDGGFAGDGSLDPGMLRRLVPDLPLPVDRAAIRGDEPEWREGDP
ncbi:MAG TPA: DUF309 domain-containing protein [Bacillota bacterium]